jgi:hypothetical protein
VTEVLLAAPAPSTDHLPAWLALTGAVIVATIAAVTAQLRQHQALKEERRRLERQLMHDRQLRDLAELRSVLANLMSQANEGLTDLLWLVGYYSDPRATEYGHEWRGGLAERLRKLRQGRQGLTDNSYVLRVLVGSDSALVAPVKIGKGAYVAAGSTIVKDVPPDALGIARGRQENKEGWAKRRR